MTKRPQNSKVRDIAKAVGVSPGTVSNALNNRKGVSNDKRNKILAVAKEMGYRRIYQRKQEKTIKFIQFKRHGNVVGDTYFFSEVIQGIDQECRNHNYHLLMANINLTETPEADIKQYFENEVSEGIIVLATEMRSSDLHMLHSASQPLVILDNCFRESPFDCVLMNNEGGVYKAIKHFVEMGHRRIGILHSLAYINNFYFRKTAFYSAMHSFGLSVDNNDVFLLSSNTEDAYRDMLKILEGLKSMPTALFAENDLIALGAIRALKEKGYRVPDDVSVIGFDDILFCEMSSPRLTTINVDKHGMGALAVKQVLNIINKCCIKSVTKLEVNTNLVIRDSVKELAANEISPSDINDYL